MDNSYIAQQMDEVSEAKNEPNLAPDNLAKPTVYQMQIQSREVLGQTK